MCCKKAEYNIMRALSSLVSLNLNAYYSKVEFDVNLDQIFFPVVEKEPMSSINQLEYQSTME